LKNKIRLQFLGAAGYVTGSRTLLETPHDKKGKNTKLFIDAGIYQGLKYIEKKNYDVLDENFDAIDAVVLTHGHIDHCGLLPLLIKNGFKGKIYCTHSTFEILKIVLPDSGKIQEEEYKFLSQKKKNKLSADGPLYTEADARKVFSYVKTISFNKKFKVNNIQLQFIWAGHILGAASVHVQYKNKTILFSGDIGPQNPIFHKLRDKPLFAEHIILESTYGDKNFIKDKSKNKQENYETIIQKSIKEIIQKRGMLIIPSFAVGRAQLILYELYRLMNEEKIPLLPVYLDSPMSLKATTAYSMFPDELNNDVNDSGFFNMIQNALSKIGHKNKAKELLGGWFSSSNNHIVFNNFHFIDKFIDSIQLNKQQGPGIIISAGGMCQGGRILHHLFNRIYDRRNVILFIGYQAEGTLGRNIVMGSQRIKIFGKELPVRAELKSIHSFTAHSDQNGLITWIKKIPQKNTSQIKTIFIQHGENSAREILKDVLIKKLYNSKNIEIEIPKNKDIYYI